MIIKSSFKEYEAAIKNEFDFLDNLKNEKNKLFVIDSKVYEIYRHLFDELLEDEVLVIHALEENKKIDMALQICERMTEIPAKRNAHLISIGGGIVQDITGFSANILYRGIQWTFVPTTLLAACDSCIGGKTSLNYKKYKNLLGTFYPPDKIYICPKFFQSLEQKDFESGLGEVVKFNIMYGDEGLKKIENSIDDLLERKEDCLNEYVRNSLLFKKDFIESDEFDKGERIKLNFAHTFGHAFETVSKYEIPHGTAVAMGMIVADRISMSRGYLDKNFVTKVENVLKKIIHFDLKKYDMEELLDAIRKDKKQVDENITAVLFNSDKKLEIYHDVQRTEIEDAFYNLCEILN